MNKERKAELFDNAIDWVFGHCEDEPECVRALKELGFNNEEITECMIAKFEGFELIRYIERTYTGGGIYLYRGRTADGRYFIGSTDFDLEVVKENILEMDWAKIFDGSNEWDGWYAENSTGETIMDAEYAWEVAWESKEV